MKVTEDGFEIEFIPAVISNNRIRPVTKLTSEQLVLAIRDNSHSMVSRRNIEHELQRRQSSS